MPILHLDFETRSAVLLKSSGAWHYAAHPSTEVLCVGYAVDDGPVQIWMPEQPIPPAVFAAARDPGWTVAAHNAQFEFPITELVLHPRHGWPRIPLERYRCSMAQARAAALPGALEKAAAALDLPLSKDREGYRAMSIMSRPCKGEDPNQLHWHDTPEDRAKLERYCKCDTELARAVSNQLPPLSDAEQQLWLLDAVINRRGFAVDRALALAARNLTRTELREINAEIAAITGGRITTANQRDRIVAFVREHGHQLQSLTKRSVAAVLAHGPGPDVRRLLELRRDGSKASTRKLDALLAGLDTDNRLRGTLNYHAASTGRWSGTRFQPQNLKKPETKDLTAAAVDAVLTGNRERVLALGAPLTIVGDISRALICAAPGYRLIGADFSAIECRALAWLANEKKKVENFREYDRTGDPTREPYCVTASKICSRPITPADEAERAIGKIAELAGGYGGSVGAWRKFAPGDTRSDGEILRDIQAWRRAHPATVRFWRELERAAKRAIRTGKRIAVGDRLAFEMEGRTLYLTLPSGRRLAYPEARIGPGKFEYTTQIYFMDNASGAWTETSAWHGVFAENATSATCRDLLAAAMLRLEAASYPIVLHVHDEIVAEVPEGFGSPEEFLSTMTVVPDWAEGCPIAAKAWTGARYVKTAAAPAVAPAAPTTIEAEEIAAPQIQPDTEEGDDDDADLPSLADLIGEPLDSGNRILCPFHDDHHPSLVVYATYYRCFACGAQGDHFDWLEAVEGMDRAEAQKYLASWEGAPAPRAERDPLGSREFALKLWNAARPITGTLAAKYLGDTRGIDLAALPADVEQHLRFHPRCPFGAGVLHPCLLTLMRAPASDTVTGIQRTALTPDAKKIDRRMLGRSGVVKLWPAGSQLVVGEGLETTLAAATRLQYRDAPLRPAWAMLSSDNLEHFPVIGGVKQLIVLVDNDRNGIGQAAAARCRDRWLGAGRTVIRLTPNQAESDFNDLILSKAAS
jgi:DNA polymerase